MWTSLPEELWGRILEMGIESSNFSYKDVCCLSITCTLLNRLSNDDSLWSSLFSADFPQYQHPSSSSSSLSNKSLYKIRYEKVREQKLLAHKRAVLRIQSEINEHSRRIRGMELRSAEEKEKMNNTIAELLNLRKIRQAKVALNVWQPEIVRGRQKEIVEQCNVLIDNRIHGTEMELKLCKQQIEGLEKTLRVEKKRMQTAKEKLASVEYHPLREFNLTVSPIDEHDMRRKRLKNFIKCKVLEVFVSFLGSNYVRIDGVTVRTNGRTGESSFCSTRYQHLYFNDNPLGDLDKM